MACPEALRLQAYFDGELDASAAADIERHVQACDECMALLQSLEAVRNAMRQQTLYHRASPKLESRVADALIVKRNPGL
jgi:anti-sigma factor (TIGR02949 family)